MHDPNIARKIVGLLRITAEDSVLEIGPGPGALTRFIAERTPARLLVVEKDAYWAEATARLLGAYDPAPSSDAEEERLRAAEAVSFYGGGSLGRGESRRAAEAVLSRTPEARIRYAVEPAPADADRQRVLYADALTLPFERFSPGWKIIGNLPYNIASPLLWELFSRMHAPARAVFMLQKEVGLRLTAAPGSRAYGALSVWLQSFIRPRAAFVVPPHVFHPRPKVDSMVLVFEPLGHCPPNNNDREGLHVPADVACAPMEPACASAHLPCSPEDLAGTLRACFRMRRKQMGSIAAAGGIAPHRLEALGINPRSRPENLTPAEFQRLAAARLLIDICVKK